EWLKPRDANGRKQTQFQHRGALRPASARTAFAAGARTAEAVREPARRSTRVRRARLSPHGSGALRRQEHLAGLGLHPRLDDFRVSARRLRRIDSAFYLGAAPQGYRALSRP